MSSQKQVPITIIEDRTFGQEPVVLDFHEFRNCRFDHSTLIYMGYGQVGLIGCTFINSHWTFEGPAANTMKFMEQMYKHGAGSEKLVEGVFELITGKHLS